MASRVIVFPGLSGLETEIKPLLHEFRHQNVVGIAYPDWRNVHHGRFCKAAFLAHCRMQIGPFDDVAFFGYSFGGLVAFALAAEELRAGRPAPVVGLLDTPARSDYLKPPLAPFMVRVLRAVYNGVVVNRVWNRLARMMIKAGWPLDLMHTLRKTSRLSIALQCNCNLPILEDLYDAMASITDPLPMSVVLFRCTQQVANLPDDLGWSALVEQVRVVDIPGTHVRIGDKAYASVFDRYVEQSG